ncbi:MAG TPA: hypothetical protein VHQ41_02600 [Patescibacteria group bacterium]|jgi:hypothetical protein|nr:hypothetical protein [Patescibacteria group bacterium]
MNTKQRDKFIYALENQLFLVEHISYLSTWFGGYQKEAEQLEGQRAAIKAAMLAFNRVAAENQITADLFAEGNASGISAEEFSMLTNPDLLNEKEVGDPDDISPWERVSMIPSWKFTILAVLLSTLCQGLNPSDLLKGYNMLYMMERCYEHCPYQCEKITTK